SHSLHSPLPSFPTRRSSDLTTLSLAGSAARSSFGGALRGEGVSVGSGRAGQHGRLEFPGAAIGAYHSWWTVAFGEALTFFKSLEDRKSTRLNSSHSPISYSL